MSSGAPLGQLAARNEVAVAMQVDGLARRSFLPCNAAGPGHWSCGPQGHRLRPSSCWKLCTACPGLHSFWLVITCLTLQRHCLSSKLCTHCWPSSAHPATFCVQPALPVQLLAGYGLSALPKRQLRSWPRLSCWTCPALPATCHAQPARLVQLLADQCWCPTEELAELQAKEKEAGIEPDWEIDAFMKAQVREGKKDSIVTEMIIKMLGLDVSLHQYCAVVSLQKFLHAIQHSWCRHGRYPHCRGCCTERVSPLHALLLCPTASLHAVLPPACSFTACTAALHPDQWGQPPLVEHTAFAE